MIKLLRVQNSVPMLPLKLAMEDYFQIFRSGVLRCCITIIKTLTERFFQIKSAIGNSQPRYLYSHTTNWAVPYRQSSHRIFFIILYRNSKTKLLPLLEA